MAQSMERKEVSDRLGVIQTEMVNLMKVLEKSKYRDRYEKLYDYCNSYLSLSNDEFVKTTDIADK